MTVIIAVLAAFDGKGLPELPMDITLNTFLAFFATFSKSSFTIPITEALSQWKWNLFAFSGQGSDQSRPLADFQIVNSASRGTWGSWLLLQRFKWRYVTPCLPVSFCFPDHHCPLSPRYNHGLEVDKKTKNAVTLSALQQPCPSSASSHPPSASR